MKPFSCSFTTCLLFSLMMLLTGSLGLSQEASPARDEAIQDATAPDIVSDKPVDPPVPQYREGGILFDNGPLISHPGGGAGGADASAITTGLNLFGSNHSGAPFRVTDNFTVTDPGGWQIDSITFFAYQTQAAPGGNTSSSFTRVSYQIWDGPPMDVSSQVVFGDTSTNTMISTRWTGIWRVTSTTLTNTQRGLMRNTVAVNEVFPPGTYWIDWFCSGTIASGPWVPPVTIPGQLVTGDAFQWTGTVWQQVRDSVAPNPGNRQGYPFIVYGSVVGGGGGSVTVTRSGLNKPIPDNNTTGVSDTITISGVPSNNVATRVIVTVDSVMHTWIGDLIFRLTKVGTTQTIIDRPGYTGTGFGNSCDNFVGTILIDSVGLTNIENITPATCTAGGTANSAGMFNPNNPLSVFNGANPNGDWILNITDNAAADVGSLRGWSITIYYEPGTDVGNDPTTIPETYVLKQNYPNPFNPSTTIRFGLPEAAEVSVRVYNVLGQQVAALVDGNLGAGSHEVVWDGKTTAGSPVSTGVYFYRLEARSSVDGGIFTDLKKMVFMK